MVFTALFPLRRLRQKSIELVMWMSCANIGSNLNVLSLLLASNSGRSGSGLCDTFGFFSVFFYVAGALWAMIIANTLSLVLIRRNDLMAQCTQLDSFEDINGKG